MSFGSEVGHEVGEVVVSLLPVCVHLAVDRRRVVVLDDELDHGVAEVAKGVRHVGFVCRAAVREFVASMMRRDDERSGAVQAVPFVDGAIEIVDVQAIGPDARLALVGVEGRRVMICLTKGAPGVFLSLPDATAKEEGGQ